MITTLVNCDTCNKDISSGGRINLNETFVESRSGNVVFSVGFIPELEKNMQFCSLKCVKEWLNVSK